MKKTYVVVCCGMLAALGVLLGGPLSIPSFTMGAYTLNISFGLVPGMFAGILFGPLYGFMCGAVTDILKFLLFTSARGGYYDPMFTFSFALMCLIPALILRKKKDTSFPWILLSVLIAQLIGSIGINTMWMVYHIGLPAATMIERVVGTAVMIPCNSVLLFVLAKSKGYILAKAQNK